METDNMTLSCFAAGVAHANLLAPFRGCIRGESQLQLMVLSQLPEQMLGISYVNQHNFNASK